MEKTEGQIICKQVENAIRSEIGVTDVQVAGYGEVTFNTNRSPENEASPECRCRLFIYPDIHKSEVIMRPLPTVSEGQCTAVMNWFLQMRNRQYRKDYGISCEYRTRRGMLELEGTAILHGNPGQDVVQLIRMMEHDLTEDFPAISSIQNGKVPDPIRTELTKELQGYQEELNSPVAAGS